MIKFIKKIFTKKENNLIAFIDIGAFGVKTIICEKGDLKNGERGRDSKNIGKILSEGYSKNENFCFQNGNISDIKSLKTSISDSLNDAENKILASVNSIVFGLSGDFDNFMQKNFRTNIEILADEIGGKFEGFYCLNSLNSCFLDEKKSGIFVNIGSNSTNISVIQDGNFLGNENFFLGGDLFTKRISNIFSISQGEADKIKILFNLGKNKNSNFNLKSEDFKNDSDLFFTAFFVSLKNFNASFEKEVLEKKEEKNFEKNISIKLPNKIYLTGGGSLFGDLRDRFRSDRKYFEKLGFSGIPNLESLEFGDKFFKKETEKNIFGGCLLLRKFYFRK